MGVYVENPSIAGPIHARHSSYGGIMLDFHFKALSTIGKPTIITSWISLVAGVWGIIYGLRAKQFTAYGHLTGREREHFVPNWRYRLLVILIATVAVLSSLRFLLKNM
jgi:hypothetical protein